MMPGFIFAACTIITRAAEHDHTAVLAWFDMKAKLPRLFHVCSHKGGMPPAPMPFYFIDNRALGSTVLHVPDSAIDALFWSPPLWGE